MDPELLQQYAAMAGVTQQQEPDRQFSTTGTLTDEDILANFVPNYTAPPELGEMEPISFAPPELGEMDPISFERPSPSAPGTPTPTPAPASTKTKVAGSVSASGFSPAKSTVIARGPGARLDQNIANLEARGQAEAAADVAPFAAANELAKTTTTNETTASVAQIDALGRQKALLAKLLTDYDTQTEATIAAEQAKGQMAKANYVASLNEFRAARVNPAQLWDNMSGGQQLGTLATAFVQDFLGAAGIHTSAMATLNKAIDRNIDAQIKAIEVKGRAADGFKTLWDMQMAESGSVQEARTRMRGFMLESAKTAVEAHMAQYESALATAKGQSFIAGLDKELANTIYQINKSQDATTATRVTQAIARYGHELDASQASARLQFERQKHEAEMKAKAAEKAKSIDPYSGLVFDTTESGQGAPIAEFIEGVSPEEKKDFRVKQASASKLVQLQREYQSLLRKYKNQDIAGGTRFQKTDTARLRNVALEIFNTRAKIQTGAAITSSEEKRFKSATPDALFGTQFDVGRVIAQTQRHVQDELAITQQGITKPLHPDDPRRGLANPRTIQGVPEYGEAGLIEGGEDTVKSQPQLHTEEQVKRLSETVAGDISEEPETSVKSDYDRFRAVYPGVAEATAANEGGAYNPKAQKAPREFAVGLSKLKEQAIQAKQDGDAATYDAAVEQLRIAALPAATGLFPKSERKGGSNKARKAKDATDTATAYYSLLMLSDLGEDPNVPGNFSVETPGPGTNVVHETLPGGQ